MNAALGAVDPDHGGGEPDRIFRSQVESNVRRLVQGSTGGRLLLAVSGGADSMALWDVLARIASWPLTIYHLDHGLRAEAAQDAALIRTRADWYEQQGLGRANLIIEACDIAQLGHHWRCSIEAAGRRQRYARLTEHGRALDIAAVVTAHHRDDQAETLLAILLRGAGPVGRAGIAERRILSGDLVLIRPVLDFGRDVLRAYCRRNGLVWNEDATNRDMRFQRNFLRHDVLPTFERGVPGLREELIGLARTHQRIIADGEGLVADMWQGGWSGTQFRLASIEHATALVRGQVWRHLLRHLGVAIERRSVAALERLANGPVGKQATLGHWLLLRRRASVAWQLQRPVISPAIVSLNGPGTYERAGQIMTCLFADTQRATTRDEHVVTLDRQACAFPFAWRLGQPNAGDPSDAMVTRLCSNTLRAKGCRAGRERQSRCWPMPRG